VAENTVVKDQITEEMIEAGAKLTRKLDEVGVNPTLALWLFMPEIGEWRLLFATPDVATQGSLKVYEQIRLVLEELGEKAAGVPFSAIGLLDPNAELVQGLRLTFRTGPTIGRARFIKCAFNGVFVEDALIYRVA